MTAFPSLCAPQKFRPAAQRSGGHRRLATRKAMGDPASHGGAGDPASVTRQCVGSCDRGLEKARHTSAVRRPPPSPPGSLLLGFGPSLFSSAGTFAQSDVARWTQVQARSDVSDPEACGVQNLSFTDSPFPSFRAVLVTPLPSSDRYAADWRGPQTQRRYS